MNKVITADTNGTFLYDNKIDKDNLITANLSDISDYIKKFLNCNTKDIIIIITGQNMNIQKINGESLNIMNYKLLFDFVEFKDFPIQIQRYLNINCVIKNNKELYNNSINNGKKYHHAEVRKIIALLLCAGIGVAALGNYLYDRVSGLKDDDYEDIPPQPQAELNIETPPPTTAVEEFLEISPKEEITKTIKEKLENQKPLATMATPNIQNPIEGNQSAIKEDKVIERCIDFIDESNSDKAKKTKEYYADLINKIAPKYGIDPALFLAICTTEGGVHRNETYEGGGIGLTQIQESVWVDKDIYVPYYKLNPETNKFERHILTRIDSKDAKELEKNIEYGCIIFDHYYNKTNYNLIATLQMNNQGEGTMYDMIDEYIAGTSKTRDDVFNDENDLGWMDLRSWKGSGEDGTHIGYTESVFGYLGDNKEITMYNYKENKPIKYLIIKERKNTLHQ